MQVPVIRVREIWLLISITIRAAMVKAGCSMMPGQTNVQNDPFCIDELYKHVCIYRKQ